MSDNTRRSTTERLAAITRISSIFLIILAAAAALEAHEVAVLSRSSDEGAKRLLPVVVPGAHLALSTDTLDFGEVKVSESAQRSFTMTNVTAGHTLDIVISGLGGGVTASPSSLTLAPGAQAAMTVTYAPTAGGVLERDLVVQTSHPGVATPVTDAVALSGEAFTGPILELRIDGMLASSFDFGPVARRAYDDLDAPQFVLEVHNVGDRSTTVEVIGTSTGANPVGSCTAGMLSLCVEPPAGGSNSQFVVGASGRADTIWRLYVDTIGDFDKSLTLAPTGGAAPKSFSVTGTGVPHLPPLGRTVQAQAIGTSPGGETLFAFKMTGGTGGGDNVDGATNDPFASYRPRGFDPAGLFDLDEVDIVEARSGNMTFRVPIAAYTVRGPLAYSLVATYNSDIWARKTIYARDQDDNSIAYNSEIPDPVNNSGMGWALHLGRLREPLHFPTFEGLSPLAKERFVDTGSYWVYIAPDGVQHRLTGSLNHAFNPFNRTSELNTKPFLYARDGSHIRMRRVSDSERHIEFPDGRVHVFERVTPVVASQPDPWRLKEIRGPFDQGQGNVVRIQYSHSSWTITDPWRTTRINFRIFSSFHFPRVVESVVLEGFERGPSRTFTFTYQTATKVPRPNTDTFHRLPDYEADGPVTVPLLHAIIQPDLTIWRFTYDGAPGGLTELRMTAAELPTGGQVEWEYGSIPDTTVADCSFGANRQLQQGVVRRRAADTNGVELAETRYLREARRHPEDLPDATEPGVPQETAACAAYFPQTDGMPPYRVRTPAPELLVGVWTELESGLSSLDLRYFSIWPFGRHPESVQGWDKRERGLNMTRAQPMRGDRSLATTLYSCSRLPADGVEIDELLTGASACTAEESRYLRYELPQSDRCEHRGGTPCHVGARVIEEETVYHQDLVGAGFRSALVQRSDYDGLGHYRSEITDGNFARGNVVTSFRNWNADNCFGTACTLILDGDGSVAQDVPLPARWLLETFTDWSVAEGSVVRGGEACFDASNGWRTAERTWAGAARGPRDVVAVNRRDEFGQLTVQRLFGADTYRSTPNGPAGNLPTGAGWCEGLGLTARTEPWEPVLDDYSIHHRYDAGFLSRRWTEGTTVYDVWREIDDATGWVSEETLTSGETMAFTYDDMGRLLTVTSDETAGTELTYTPPAALSGWRVATATYRRGQGSSTGAAPLTEYRADFDGLGRPVVEGYRHPDGSFKNQLTAYHPSGLVASLSTLNRPAKSTRFAYDYKGRRSRIDMPDGEQVLFWHRGDENVRRIVDVRSPTGTVRSAVRRRFDRQGRVWRVEEGSLNGNNDMVTTRSTTFTFDPLGEQTSATRGVQTRSVSIDGRGFVLAETIPEKTTERRLSDFNTRGQARRVLEQGLALEREERWTFDRLGRPELLTVDGLTIKDWTYAPSCTATAGGTFDLGGCAGNNGQLIEALRVNHRGKADTGEALCLGDCVREEFRVTSGFGYDGAGRVDFKDVEVRQKTFFAAGTPRNVSSAAWTQSWAYDDLGRVVDMGYPLGNGQGGRAATFRYTAGLLTDVISPALGATLTYHADGTLATVTHDNGRVDSYGADASGMSRIGSIDLASGELALGGFTYDGAGNVTAIGIETFRYDESSRLVSATVRSHDAGTLSNFAYAYDQYDNRLGTASAQTNHLALPGVAYDVFGNQTEGVGHLFLYDEVDKVKAVFEPPEGGGSDLCVLPSTGERTPCALSIYDHEDLRILSVRAGGPSTWAARDLEGKILSEFVGNGAAQISHSKDYVYAGDYLLASRSNADIRHYHLDHLGTPRVVSRADGTVLTRQYYGPYGDLLNGGIGERLDFTGHERELDGETLYMRGRQYLIPGGRFLQVDPARDLSAWSQYTYVANNPVVLFDPDGREPADAGVRFAGYTKVVGAALSLGGGGLVGAVVSMQGNFIQGTLGATTGDTSKTIGGVSGLVASLGLQLSGPAALGSATAVAGSVMPWLGVSFAVDFLTQEIVGERPLPFLMGNPSMLRENQVLNPDSPSNPIEERTIRAVKANSTGALIEKESALRALMRMNRTMPGYQAALERAQRASRESARIERFLENRDQRLRERL